MNETDLDKRVRTVSAERMKAKRIHRVPLIDRTVEIPGAATGMAPYGNHRGDWARSCPAASDPIAVLPSL
jgi:hypothetical protein